MRLCLDEYISVFSTSALREHSNNSPWELTSQSTASC